MPPASPSSFPSIFPSYFSGIFVFVIILLTTATNAFSQKIIKDTVTIQYHSPPATPLPDNIYTYSVHLSFSTPEKQKPLYQNPDSLTGRKYKLYGYVQDNDGDLKIEILVGSYENKPDDKQLLYDLYKKGPDPSKPYKFGYKYQISHRLPVYFKVTSNNDETIIPSVWVNNSNQYSTTLTDTAFNSKKGLKEYWRHHSETAHKKAENKLLDTHLNSIFTILNKHFGFNHHTKTLDVYSAQATDQYSYTDLARAAGLAKNAYTLYSTDKFNNSVSSLMLAQEIWVQALEEFYTSTKEGRINKEVALGLHYNLMMSSIWLENFDAAFKHIHKAEALEKDNGWTSYWTVFVMQQSAIHQRSY